MNRIDDLRREKRMTVDQVCSEIGICRKTYYNHIKNNQRISADKIVAYSRLFDVPSDYILGIKDYTHITVTDNAGAVLADIGNREIIEHDSVKVILT